MSPIFSSPMKDFGYDVSDYRAIAPEFGTIDDLDALVAAAHERGIAVVFDMILGHTSIEHAWFRDQPDDFYIRAERPLNNWTSVFGGSMWTKDPYRDGYYMHRFYDHQPDLNWRNAGVRAAMYDVMQFWVDRGIDVFRLDAIDGLYRREDMADMPLAAPMGMDTETVRLSELAEVTQFHRDGYDSNLPETIDELGRIRAAFLDSWFVGEALSPVHLLEPHLEHVNAMFNFEFQQAPLTAKHMAEVLQRAVPIPGLAWVLSNHDFSRLVTRAGRDMAKLAAVLLLALPGTAFIYQGDEIGMIDGPGSLNDEPYDLIGRDSYRHPMQWTPAGGFTTGTPWLPMTDPAECNVASQSNDSESMLSFYRVLIELRKTVTGDLSDVRSDGDLLVFRRGNMIVACNLGDAPLKFEEDGQVLIDTDRAATGSDLPPHSALILRPS